MHNSNLTNLSAMALKAGTNQESRPCLMSKPSFLFETRMGTSGRQMSGGLIRGTIHSITKTTFSGYQNCEIKMETKPALLPRIWLNQSAFCIKNIYTARAAAQSLDKFSQVKDDVSGIILKCSHSVVFSLNIATSHKQYFFFFLKMNYESNFV